MKKKEFVQVKSLDIKELKEKSKTIQKEITDLMIDKNMKKLKDLKTISKKKKELAQILTVVRQKEQLEQLSVLSGQPALPAGRSPDRGQSVVSESENREQRIGNKKNGGKK